MKRVLMGALAALGINAYASVTFRGETSCPELGLRIREMASSRAAPLPSPTVYPITVTHGDGRKENLEMSVLRELWMLTQCRLRLEDDEGNTLYVGVPTAMPAKCEQTVEMNIDGEVLGLATKSDCAKAIEAGQRDWENASIDESHLVKWLEEFAGAKLGEAQKVRASMGAKRIVYYPSSKENQGVWLFSTAMEGEDSWFGLVVEVTHGINTARKNVEKQFFGALRNLPGAKLIRPKRKALSSRAEATSLAKAAIANMDGWWSAEAPGYMLVSNLRSSKGKKLMRDLQRELPAMRKTMERMIPGAGQSNEVCVVRVFADDAEYRAYLGNGQEWSVGCWIPMRRELVALHRQEGKKAEDDTGKTIHHEALHQYLFYALRQIEVSLWYNEGHACLFENSRVDSRGRVKFEKYDHWHYRQLRKNLLKASSMLFDLMQMNHAKFYGGAQSERTLKYATAWGLVYFLRSSQKRYPQYSEILERYRKALLDTGDALRATEVAFDGVNRGRFVADFTSYWSEKSK